MPKIFKVIFFILLGILIFSFITYKMFSSALDFFADSEQIPLLKTQKTQILTKSPLTEAEKILSRLTLEQKIGQLFIVGFEGDTLTPEIKNLIETFHPGGVFLLKRNIENEKQLKELINSFQKISLENNRLPLFIAIDQEGDPISRIEWIERISQSEIKNENQAYQVGLKRGKELKELGINLNLAPVLDITNPDDFLRSRSFQKTPEEAGGLAKAIILGQKTAGILTVIKHFPGYGEISFNPEEKLAIKKEIPEISQFQITMEAKPEMVMTSNVIYREIDEELLFTFSRKSIQFLKENLGEEILIISDDLAQNSLLKEFSLTEIVTLSIKAGVDILSFSGWRVPVEDGMLAFQEAVKNNEISEERINQSVLRIIKIKQKLLELNNG